MVFRRLVLRDHHQPNDEVLAWRHRCCRVRPASGADRDSRLEQVHHPGRAQQVSQQCQLGEQFLILKPAALLFSGPTALKNHISSKNPLKLKPGSRSSALAPPTEACTWNIIRSIEDLWHDLIISLLEGYFLRVLFITWLCKYKKFIKHGFLRSLCS